MFQKPRMSVGALPTRATLTQDKQYMAEIKEAKLNDLIQDDRNLNKGTERGQQLIEKSLREFGAGRSVLIGKNNRIIAGNKTHQNASLAGLDDVIIVETDGTKLVAVKRTDVDLDTKKGREMALADNATVKVDLQWDTEELNAVAEDFGIDADEWDVETELEINEPKEKPEVNIEYSYKIEVELPNESEQEKLYNELTERGYECRILTL